MRTPFFLSGNLFKPLGNLKRGQHDAYIFDDFDWFGSYGGDTFKTVDFWKGFLDSSEDFTVQHGHNKVTLFSGTRRIILSNLSPEETLRRLNPALLQGQDGVAIRRRFFARRIEADLRLHPPVGLVEQFKDLPPFTGDPNAPKRKAANDGSDDEEDISKAARGGGGDAVALEGEVERNGQGSDP